MNWYKKRSSAFFLLSAMTLVFITSLTKLSFSSAASDSCLRFLIEFNWRGHDSSKIEKEIIEKLEEKLFTLPGIRSFDSFVDYGISRTSVSFEPGVKKKSAYLAIRYLTDSLYLSLPSDVQKPKIISSSAKDSSVFLAALKINSSIQGGRSWVEETLLPELECIDGVAEVIIAGGAQEEIQIAFDAVELVGRMQNPQSLSQAARDANALIPQSYISEPKNNIPLFFNTRLQSLNDLRSLPLRDSGRYTSLGNVSKVDLGSREPEEYVRLNGEDCISISIKSSGLENCIKLSKDCRKVLKKYNFPSDSFFVLYDFGKEEEEALISLFICLLQSLLFVIIILPFFYKSLSHVLLDSVFICLSLIWGTGLMSLLSIPLNQNTLSALCLSLGLASDSFFVVGESYENKGLSSVPSLLPSLAASFATTGLTLVPLYFMDSLSPGSANLSLTLFCMFFSSSFLSIVFYPCFFERSLIKNPLNNLRLTFLKKTFRLEFYLVKKALPHKKVFTFLFILLCIYPIFSFIFSGKNLSAESEGKVLHVTCDFPSSRRALCVDGDIKTFVEKVSEVPGVKCLLSTAKKGSASIDVVLEKKTKAFEIASSIKENAFLVPEAFVHLPSVKEKKKNPLTISLAVCGNESSKCREYAKKVSSVITDADVILHFKDDEASAFFIPDYAQLCRNDLTPYSLSGTLRWLFYGSVCDKWIEKGSEYDIRVFGKDLSSLSAREALSVKVPVYSKKNNLYTSLPLSSLGDICIKENLSKIYRKDGKRCAWLSLEFPSGALSYRMKDISERLKKLELEEGYYFSFSHEQEELPSSFLKLIFSLLLSLTGILLLLIALSESFFRSLLMFSVITPSLTFPLLLRNILGVPLEAADLLGFVLLSGICVNNGIYIAGQKVFSVFSRVRSKLMSILLTSLSSFLSALPLLLGAGEAFSRKFSFVIAWGIPASLAVSLIFLPLLLKKT